MDWLKCAVLWGVPAPNTTVSGPGAPCTSRAGGSAVLLINERANSLLASVSGIKTHEHHRSTVSSRAPPARCFGRQRFPAVTRTRSDDGRVDRSVAEVGGAGSIGTQRTDGYR